MKGEVNGCDLVGVREGEPAVLVVCEMKLYFYFELVLQGVNRAAISDESGSRRAPPRGGSMMRASAISAGGSASG